MTPLRAAIHVRRSTDHQETSITRQIDEAKAFAARKGWTVAPENVFHLDEVSGAVAHRPDLDALLEAASRTPRPFDVLIIQNEDRLTRIMWRQLSLLVQLHDCGVQVYRYSDGHRVRGSTAQDKLMMAVQGFQSEAERERLVQRTREASHWRGRNGWVVGGVLYGYDNVRSGDGPGSHVDRVLNEAQAVVVRRIFQRYAEGASLKGVARELNEDGVPSPRAGKRGTGTWAASAIRSMLVNPHFHGEIIAGRKRREIQRGEKVFVDVPEEQWMRRTREDLRIVDEPTWQAVQQRFEARPEFKARGREPRGVLIGNLRCDLCDARMYLVGGTGGLELRYACGRRHQGGTTTCSNAVKRPGPELDKAVVRVVAETLGGDSFLERVARRARDMERGTRDQESDELREARLRLEEARRRVDNLLNTIADTDDPTTRNAVASRLPDAQAQVARVEGQVDRLSAGETAPQNDEKDLAAWRALIGDLSSLMLSDVGTGRAALQSVLAAPMRATPIEVEGEKRFIISGLLRPETLLQDDGDPNGIRTRVAWMKTRCPGPD